MVDCIHMNRNDPSIRRRRTYLRHIVDRHRDAAAGVELSTAGVQDRDVRLMRCKCALNFLALERVTRQIDDRTIDVPHHEARDDTHELLNLARAMMASRAGQR